LIGVGYCISPTASPLVGSASAKEPYWANFHTPGTAAYCQVVPDITGGDGGPGFAAVFDPHERHEVRATTDARLLLVLAPWPGDGHPGARDD